MSKSAPMNSGLKAMAVEKYEMPTTMEVNLKKFKALDGYDVGEKCTFQCTGTVRSISKSKDGDSRMSIDVSSIQEAPAAEKA